MGKIVHKHKVIFIGDSSVGKTSIISNYMCGTSSSDSQPTIGIDFFGKTIIDNNKIIRLQIFDTAGQERFKSLIPSYIRQSTVAIFVFDITLHKSFENLEKWNKIVTEIARPIIILVGNKKDKSDQRTVQDEEIKKLAEQFKSTYIETSAKTGEGLQLMFNTLVDFLLSHYLDNGIQQENQGINVPDSKKKCC